MPISEKITERLSFFFGIMFDGWTDVSTHYIAVIATFMKNGVYYEVLLGCSPPLKEKSYTAEEYYVLLESVLAIYGESIKVHAVLIEDNCATNKALADLMSVPLIGCGYHMLNIAIKAYLARRPAIEKTIARVGKTMSQMRNLKAAGALRELTSLTPIKRNVTRWSSTHKMLQRFLQIEGSARQLDDIDAIRRADLDRIKSVMPALKDFKGIMTELQNKGQHIGVVHETFELMTEDYTELKDYLATDATISHNLQFEAAVVKIIRGEQEKLTSEEKVRVSSFLARASPDEAMPPDNEGKRSSHLDFVIANDST
ncbi:unnamed protein product [Phytophthora fragariaefolia]|uniref:Unnamed protein product n=1 Tax=Phytophthora fragariaefolia TaxID=1490495 RepID=A0A9W6U8H5_9STRA|nr:unnamed protein product [Phytophthora fragariaefolia]